MLQFHKFEIRMSLKMMCNLRYKVEISRYKQQTFDSHVERILAVRSLSGVKIVSRAQLLKKNRLIEKL